MELEREGWRCSRRADKEGQGRREEEAKFGSSKTNRNGSCLALLVCPSQNTYALTPHIQCEGRA